MGSGSYRLFVEPRLIGNLDVVSVRVADVRREALHNQTAIDGAFKAVMPDGLIGRALIPCLGGLEAREFRNHDALNGIALQNLMTAVVDEDLDLVTCASCPDLVPVNLQLRVIEGLFACEYQVSTHFSCSPLVLFVAVHLESTTYDWFGLGRTPRTGFDSRYTAGENTPDLIACVSTRRSAWLNRDEFCARNARQPSARPLLATGQRLHLLVGHTIGLIVLAKLRPSGVCQMCASFAKLTEIQPCSVGEASFASCSFKGCLANMASPSQHQPKSQNPDS